MHAYLLRSVLALCVAAPGRPPIAVARGLVEAERKARLAFDGRWFERNYTADYVEIGPYGYRARRAESIAAYLGEARRLRYGSLGARAIDARMVGEDLVTRVRIHAVGDRHTFDLAQTAQETWTRVGPGWGKRRGRTLAERLTIDGKATPWP